MIKHYVESALRLPCFLSRLVPPEGGFAVGLGSEGSSITTNGSRDGSVEFWDIFTGVTTPIANLQDPFARSLWLPSMLQKCVPVDDRPLPRLVSQ